jgi:hypothetical protein
MTQPDDESLDVLLAGGEDALPDDGFTAAVVRRVQHDERARLAPTVTPAGALARLERLASASARSRRWRWIGVASGSAFALVTLQVAGPAPLVIGLPQALAMLAALAASAWGLTDA